MIYGLYLSAQGAQAQSTRLDVIANNLANASTTGFKRDLAIYQAHPPYDVEHGKSDPGPEGWDDQAGGLTLAGVVTDHSNASLVKSGGTYDVALAGPGYFQVANDREQLLTRNGQFTVSQNGELVNDTGLRVLNESGGPIAIPPNAQNIQIAGDGTVNATFENGATAPIARLAVVQPADVGSLEKVGNSMFRAPKGVAPAGPQTFVRQGFLESSGTNSVMEMLEMIQTTRAFETNINMIKHQDEALGRLLQSASLR